MFSGREEHFFVWTKKVENNVSGVFPNVRGALAFAAESPKTFFSFIPKPFFFHPKPFFFLSKAFFLPLKALFSTTLLCFLPRAFFYPKPFFKPFSFPNLFYITKPFLLPPSPPNLALPCHLPKLFPFPKTFFSSPNLFLLTKTFFSSPNLFLLTKPVLIPKPFYFTIQSLSSPPKTFFFPNLFFSPTSFFLHFSSQMVKLTSVLCLSTIVSWCCWSDGCLFTATVDEQLLDKFLSVFRGLMFLHSAFSMSHPDVSVGHPDSFGVDTRSSTFVGWLKAT